MKQLQIFKVYPSIPEPIMFLDTLSKNLWWCWNHDAVELFRRINPGKWEAAKRNPVSFLASISQRRFKELTKDDSFIGHLQRVQDRFETMVSLSSELTDLKLGTQETIAYFSMEYGLHESLPLFAGGLGVLAGDHLKAASIQGIPMTGVGLLYREGFFHQYLDHNGWQQEVYPEIDIFDLPIHKARDPFGDEVIVSVDSPHGTMMAQVWKLEIGRIHLYLLDANISQNTPAIRNITARLYAAEAEIRIAQEVLLGVGGMRALKALGLFPAVCHLNEGHCSFAGLERISQIMQQFTVDLGTAVQICRRSGIFTTHTPVAAGHDEFYPALVRPYLESFARLFDKPVDEILSWGQIRSNGRTSPFYMCVLGMNLSGFMNGVSRLHGSVARKMWTGIWPNRPVEEIPISHITNGVHILSYISQSKAALLERYLAPDWDSRTWSRELIARVDNVDNDDLWHIHNVDRSRLIRECRKILVRQYEDRNSPRKVIEAIGSVLDPDVLTISFARRFATYKRADLLFRDPDRLEALIASETMPVQFVFSGKAHPNDKEGKELIQKIIRFASRKQVRHRMVFLEDYNINIARYMVQGCDIWLNTPRRPMEACGTSGMKAAVNGGLNVSILDGWWCEGYAENRGWCIGNGRNYDDNEYQDTVESQALYNILENDVIPCFYDRKRGNPPERWLSMMKESMKMALMDFSSYRMLGEYRTRFYVPAALNMQKLTANSAWEAKELSMVSRRLMSLWNEIRIEKPIRATSENFMVGDTFRLTARVYLGGLTPDEVEVQIYYGKMKSLDSLEGGRTQTMNLHEDCGSGCFVYACSLTCGDAGRFGYTARVIPKGDEILRDTPEFMTWAN
ncbi:MAG: alpha-glucan family phosphorylase [Pseudomonadota bacterium]